MTSLRTIGRNLWRLALPALALALQAAAPSTTLEVGLKADDPWRSPVPHPFAGDRPAWNNPWYELSVSYRENLLSVQVDTLGGYEVYTVYAPDGRRLGETLIESSKSLERRLALRNPRALSRSLGEGSLQSTSVGSDHVEIDIPFKVRSQTFRRIFGSGRIGLNVTGSISIDGTYHSEKKESESAANQGANSNDFRLDQQQQFTVVGKIGEKVDVHIDQDTERSFDFENNLSIIYTGEPEEVIESIEAGNISLSLPGTRYVSFSDRSSGLFGLKAVTRFGPLRMTGIASSEKNESKQQTFEGGTSSRTLQLGPGDYQDRIFFVNECYRHAYRTYTSQMIPSTAVAGRIETFALFVFQPNEEIQDARVRLVSPYGVDEFNDQTYSVRKISWDAANKPTEYDLDEQTGIVRLNFSLNSNQFVAMSYSVEYGTALTDWQNDYGSGPDDAFTTGDREVNDNSKVVVLVPSHFGPESGIYWDLQARNFFAAGSAGLDVNDFDLEIVKQASGASGSTSQDGINYKRIFYLDVINAANGQTGNDGRVDARWIDPETGYLSFPSPLPFGDRPESWVLTNAYGDEADLLFNELVAAGYDGAELYKGYKRAPNTGENSTTLDTFTPYHEAAQVDPIYDLRPRVNEWTALNSLLALESESTVGTDVINLGWNVTNVSVTANGRRLAEGGDYTLDELSGLIRITNPAYTRADQKIVVSYETPQLFQLRKKTFMGVKADLDLWKTGNRTSRLGAAAIYYNEETAERKIRLGNEPIKNIVLDLNTELHFEPRPMTIWVDALPLIEADEPSKLDFEAEYAMVLPDPNPANNPATGDDSGVAYVDDFESSKQEIPLSLGHSQWSLSSKPVDETLSRRGRLRWKNPTDKVPSSTIWPNYQNSDQEGINNDVRVLRLAFEPFRLAGEDDGGDPLGGPVARSRSWGGFYYDFHGAYDDFSEKKFIEITMRVDGDRSGKLHVDLGLIDEDVIPNGDRDTEDLNRNNILETSEDIGLDGMAGPDPPWPPTPELFAFSGDAQAMQERFGAVYDWWDLNGDGVREPHEDWSYDDYSKSENDDPTTENLHGSEGNSQDLDQRGPDTEDRNGNLQLDQDNDYFSWSVPLNRDDPDYDRYVIERDRTSWFLVRIPLSDEMVQRVGNPQLSVVNGLRLWISGCTDPVTIQLAEFGISGTDWQEALVADSDTSHHEITVLNNFDDDGVYYGPPGVEGQKDIITGIVAREQSLVIQLEGLPFGRTAWVRKQLATPISFTEYRELKMFVHGGGNNPDVVGGDDSSGFADRFGEDRIEFLMRIQSTEGNYYEYSKFVRAGWDPLNDMRIVFDEITGIDAFSAASREQEDPDKPVLLSDGALMRVVGSPSINQVRTLLFGVKNHSPEPATTQVWVNELRVSDVKKEIGRAFRVQGTANFSDVLSLSSSFEQTDAEYHTVKERVRRTGNETLKRLVSVSGSTDLGRLLPPAAGVTARLQADASRNYQLPKFYPNDDQEVDAAVHPQWIETVSRSRGATLTLGKSGSKKAWARNTLDKITFTTSLSETVRRDRRVEADTTVRQKFQLGYSSTISWSHRLKPLGFADEWPLLGSLAGLEIGYMPSNVGLSASTDRTLQHTWNRDASVTHSESYSLSRRWSTSFPLVNALTVSMNRDYGNNLLFARDQTLVPERLNYSNELLAQQYDDFVRRLADWREGKATLFDGDHRINQGVDLNFRPTLLDWLTTDFGYSTSYSWTRDLANPVDGVSVGNTGNFRADLKLKPTKLTQKLFFMSDASLNDARREIGDLKKEREAAREERREERRLRKERRQAEEDAENAPALDEAEPAPPDDDPVPPDDGKPEPREGNPPPEPFQPLEAPGEESRLEPPLAAAPLGMEPLPPDARDDAGLPPDSLAARPDDAPLDDPYAALPDSLRRQIAIADSLIQAGRVASPAAATAPDEALADSVAAPAEPQEREPSRLLLAVGTFLRHGRQRAVLSAGLIDDISIGFKRRSSRSDPGLAVYPWTPLTDRHASLPYQLALSSDPGLDTLRLSQLTYRTSRNFGYDYNLGTRLNAIPSVPIRLRYDYRFDQSFTDDRESSRSEKLTGWYSFDNEPLVGKGDFEERGLIGWNPVLHALPNYGLSIQGLQRLPFVKNFVKSLSLSHEYTGSLDVTYTAKATDTGTEMVRSRLAYSKSFAPLTGFDFQLEKGWGGQLNYNVRRTLTVNDPDGLNRKLDYRVTRGWSLSGSKALSKGFKLPGIRKRFDNQTTLRLTYSNNATQSLATAPEPDELGRIVWNTPTETRDWSLEARADMTFSRYVTGGASWKYGVSTSSAANDRTSYMDFGVNCRVQIRSR